MLSLVAQAYELNADIPNAELLFYRIFQTPITLHGSVKEGEHRDILDGRIFERKGRLMPLNN